MVNPLGGDTAGRSNRTLRVGESRVVNIKDKAGVIVDTLTIVRTERPYAFDLCDAYNTKLTNNNVKWVVGHDGNPHLEFIQCPVERGRELARKAEAERQKWLHRHRNPHLYT